MSFVPKLCSHIFSGLRALGSFGVGRNMHVLTQVNVISAAAKLAAFPEAPKLLQPPPSLLMQVAGFKVKGRLRRRCKDCYVVIRQQRSYIICPTHRRHKQMSMKKRDYKSWVLTHATQSKERPY